MTVLLWLAIPLVALIIGIVWAYLINRPPRPAAMQESMESFSRFRRALAQHQTPGQRHRKLGSRPVSREPERSSSRSK